MHQTTVLSQKGQVVLPKALRDACRWNPGTLLHVRETPEGLLLTAAAPLKTRDASTVAGCTGYKGPVRSIDDMQDAIRKGVAERHARR